MSFVMDETALIQQAKRGDLDAFNRLVIAYQTKVFNLAYRVMGDSDSAADATQEAFISAYKNIRRFRGGSFQTWLYRIVTNACYDEFRRRKRRPADSLDELSEVQDGYTEESIHTLSQSPEKPEKEVERAELIQAIHKCLERLPMEFRIVVVLVDVQGFDYRQVSEVIEKPLGTVKSRVARARDRMRECLRGFGELLPTPYR